MAFALQQKRDGAFYDPWSETLETLVLFMGQKETSWWRMGIEALHNAEMERSLIILYLHYLFLISMR